MAEGKASKKYKEYINSLDKEQAVTVAIAMGTPDGFGSGKAVILTKKDIATSQNDEHFILAKILPALKEQVVEIVREYKKQFKSQSFTADLLGGVVTKKMDALGEEVRAELEKQHEMDAPAEEQYVSTTAKPAKGFISK